MVWEGVLNGWSTLTHLILKNKLKSLYTLRALPLFQGDTKPMFPWEIIKSPSHILCLWEAAYCTVVCPKLLHIPAALGHGSMAQGRVPLWSHGSSLLSGPVLWQGDTSGHDLWAAPTAASELGTGFVGSALTNPERFSNGTSSSGSSEPQRGVGGLREALLHFPCSTEFQAG